MIYTYEGITQEPNIYTKKDGSFVSGIYFDIWNGVMENKNITGTKWDGVSNLTVSFDTELSVGDKAILDTIVSNNLVKPIDPSVSVDDVVDPISPSGSKFKIGVTDEGILYTEQL